MSCDFEQCKKNADGTCIATGVEQCPKNNAQSVYEDVTLLKDG